MVDLPDIITLLKESKSFIDTSLIENTEFIKKTDRMIIELETLFSGIPACTLENYLDVIAVLLEMAEDTTRLLRDGPEALADDVFKELCFLGVLDPSEIHILKVLIKNNANRIFEMAKELHLSKQL